MEHPENCRHDGPDEAEEEVEIDDDVDPTLSLKDEPEFIEPPYYY